MPERDPFEWVVTARRWRNTATGRFVSPQVVRDGLEGTIDAAERRMLATAGQLARQEISIADWQRVMVTEIKDLHINAARAAAGGELSSAMWGTVGALLREQYKFLAIFGGQIANSGQRFDGTFPVRVGMYAHAARGAFERVRGVVEKAAGMLYEYSVRNAGDSCSDCVEAENAGPVPIGTLKPVGSRKCLTRCRCTMEYGKEPVRSGVSE